MASANDPGQQPALYRRDSSRKGVPKRDSADLQRRAADFNVSGAGSSSPASSCTNSTKRRKGPFADTGGLPRYVHHTAAKTSQRTSVVSLVRVGGSNEASPWQRRNAARSAASRNRSSTHLRVRAACSISEKVGPPFVAYTSSFPSLLLLFRIFAAVAKVSARYSIRSISAAISPGRALDAIVKFQARR